MANNGVGKSAKQRVRGWLPWVGDAHGHAPHLRAPGTSADEGVGEEFRRAARATGATADGGAGENSRHDLRAPDLYLNRELTWLAFNRRVLNEARDERTPLLERVKFLSIVSSNLDEFFMKRIGGLKHQVGAGVQKLTVDGRTPGQQIAECREAVRALLQEKAQIAEVVLQQLRQHGIEWIECAELGERERESLRQLYARDILPLVTPLGIDSAHPFPRISNLSLNLLVRIGGGGSGPGNLARVKVPVGPHSPRLVRVGQTRCYVRLEELIANNLDLLFPHSTVESCGMFRVTRNASSEPGCDYAGDLLAVVQAELRDREIAPIVRLEVDATTPVALRHLLATELGLDPCCDVYEDDGLLAMVDLRELAALEIPELRDPPHHPIANAEIQGQRRILDAVRHAGSILLQHPDQSFGSVERFFEEASCDPEVLVIKATLYRTSANTKIVDSLISAARNGKEVAVAIELKARFDEAANMRWARRLEEAGVHVRYGMVGLKTHCKAGLVVRREAKGLRRYVHVGTGNYHAGTARMYSDFGLFSCDEALGQDIAELFNTLTTGHGVKRTYRKILTAPVQMKRALLRKIEREIKLHSASSPGRIRLKTNALEDPDIVAALYRAGRAGVPVALFVRDSCRLRPGLEGLSESISVISTVGRFLEHARIYHFGNGGDEEYLIGSADLMQRNLEHRIELLVPVEKPCQRAALGRFLDYQQADRRNAWRMQPDGAYVQLEPEIGDLQPETGGLQPQTGKLQPEPSSLQPEPGSLQPETRELHPETGAPESPRDQTLIEATERRTNAPSEPLLDLSLANATAR